VIARALWAAYDAGMSLAVAAVMAPLERWRVVRGSATAGHLEERLGYWSGPPRRGGPRVVIHAVSLGEVAAAGALIAALRAARPDLGVVLTTGTRAGRAAAETHPAVDSIGYLPWDRRRAVRGWLRAVDPDAVILIEAEIWPNLLRACGDRRIPVLVANARIDPRAVARYRLVRPLVADALRAVTWVGAADEEGAAAYRAIGAVAESVQMVGNLKADAALAERPLPADWARVLAALPGPCIVAGSTHGREPAWLVEALIALRGNHPGCRLVIAPRGRTGPARRAAAGRGLRVALWSTGATRDWEVLVVDRVGQLAALYRFADVAVIGGTLDGRLGHNPLEAAAAGTSMVVGPRHESVVAMVERLRAADAAVIVPAGRDRAEALRSVLAELLADPGRRADLGRRARALVDGMRGVAERYAGAVIQRLPALR
jgi:3-deoxy-D-manno-octulosonic-acid transferase